MGTMNKVILIGNLGRDAELRYTQAGTAVTTFSIATTESWKDPNGEKKEKTEWHRIVVWGQAAEALNDYLKKGKSVAVEGKLTTRKWQDKDGHDRYSTEIKSDRIVLLGGGGTASGGRRRTEHVADEDMTSPEIAEEPVASSVGSEINDDDVPF